MKTIFSTPDAAAAADAARRLHIDYLYVDGTDVEAYPEGTRNVRRTAGTLRTRVRTNASVRTLSRALTPSAVAEPEEGSRADEPVAQADLLAFCLAPRVVARSAPRRSAARAPAPWP